MLDATAHDPHGIPPARGAEWVHYNLGFGYVRPDLGVGVNPEATVYAYLNHARWVVDCPDCCNAQLACRTDHRFMCNECGNIAAGELWRPVSWPDSPAAVEAMVENRPRENQNWTPGEEIVHLAVENLENTGKVR